MYIFQNEECFYQCEPLLKYFERPGQEGYIRDAPVCAKFCDEWFSACKEDKTCVEDWLEGNFAWASLIIE